MLEREEVMTMYAIEMLKNEHRIIEKVIDALEEYTGKIGRGEIVDAGDLGRFVKFLREFADACHHGKEEKILFDAMVKAGFREDAGPIGVMLSEHDEGRRLVGVLDGLARAWCTWDDGERKLVAATGREYASLLRNHIRKEDGILYPMAESHLDPETIRRVGAAFIEFEERETGEGEHERLHTLAEELIGRHEPCEHYHASHGCGHGQGLRI
jgi:hemerythrin-like domain-containing protein